MTWRDAHFDFDDDDDSDVDFLVETMGYLLTPTKHFVRVAQEKTPREFRAITKIPPSLIVNREVLSAQSLQVVRSKTV